MITLLPTGTSRHVPPPPFIHSPELYFLYLRIVPGIARSITSLLSRVLSNVDQLLDRCVLSPIIKSSMGITVVSPSDSVIACASVDFPEPPKPEMATNADRFSFGASFPMRSSSCCVDRMLPMNKVYQPKQIMVMAQTSGLGVCIFRLSLPKVVNKLPVEIPPA